MAEISATEVAQFKASARAAFGSKGTDEVRRWMATAYGYDPADWARIAVELDLPGLMLPETCGGAGMSAVELAYVLEEAGAALYCAPLFSTAALAVPLLLALNDAAALEAYGPAIARGELTATVALAEESGRWDLADVSTVAQPTDAGWELTGSKSYVVDGATAGLVLVVAAVPDGHAVFAVDDWTDATVSRRQLVTLDQTRKMARLQFDHTPARLVGSPSSGPAIEHASRVARALLAAEQTGGAQRCLDITVDYAKNRIQFGKPIGAFQAIKQRVADMLIKVESSRSAAYTAAAAAAGDDPDLERITRVAAIAAADAYGFVSAQAIQLHGGIGFTWEHSAHLYYKRARSSAQLLGTENENLDRLADEFDALPV